MKAYTDYPLQTNPNREVVEIEVMSYDRNKYCCVRHGGEEEEIKRGYIWKDAKLSKSFPLIRWLSLPRVPWDNKPTRLQAYRELKALNVFGKTEYSVYLGPARRKTYGNITKALTAFKNSKCDGWIIKKNDGYAYSSMKTLVERENGQLYYVERSGLSNANWLFLNGVK